MKSKCCNNPSGLVFCKLGSAHITFQTSHASAAPVQKYQYFAVRYDYLHSDLVSLYLFIHFSSRVKCLIWINFVDFYSLGCSYKAKKYNHGEDLYIKILLPVFVNNTYLKLQVILSLLPTYHLLPETLLCFQCTKEQAPALIWQYLYQVSYNVLVTVN